MVTVPQRAQQMAQMRGQALQQQQVFVRRVA